MKQTSAARMLVHGVGAEISPLLDTSDEVLDVRHDRADGGGVALGSPPDLDHDLVADTLNVALDVLERAGQSTTRTLDGNITAIDGDLDWEIWSEI